MRARWVLNLILAAIVLGLGLLAYFKPDTNKSAANALTALAPDAAAQIRLERAGQTVTLTKTPTGWRMTAPMAARANQFNVDGLLRVLTAPSSYRVPAKPDELANYGLDKPALRLRIDDEEMLVGAIHPLKREHYLLYRDGVHLVPTTVLAPAFFDYTSFISSQLLEDGRQLVALHLPGLELARQDGTWRQTSPAKKTNADLSGDRINAFVAHWQNARALSVARLSAAPSVERIRLDLETDAKRDTLVLDILAYKPELILARRDEGLEYHFPEDVGKQLLNLTAE